MPTRGSEEEGFYTLLGVPPRKRETFRLRMVVYVLKEILLNVEVTHLIRGLKAKLPKFPWTADACGGESIAMNDCMLPTNRF